MTNELALCRDFIDAHRDDAAHAMERLAAGDAAALLAALPTVSAARALDAMMPALGAACLVHLAPADAVAILAELRPGRATLLLRPMADSARAVILEQMSANDARMQRTALAQPPGSAGTVMDSRVFSARENDRTVDVLAALRRSPGHSREYVFVVDDEHRLIGLVTLWDLVAARAADSLSAIMSRSVARLAVSASRAAILSHPGWRRHHVLPVVDERSVLVGAIAHETMRALADEEALGGARVVDAATTVFALGELYWLGLSGVIDGVAAALRREASAREVPHAAR